MVSLLFSTESLKHFILNHKITKHENLKYLIQMI